MSSKECIVKISLDLDKSKKNIVYIDSGDVDKYSYMNGVGRTVYKELEKQFNIIHINTTSNCKGLKNYFKIDIEFQSELERKKDSSSNSANNEKKIWASMERMFKDIGEIEYIIIGSIAYYAMNQLSYVSKSDSEDLNSRKNEYFDYLGDDKYTIDLVNQTNKKLVDTFYDRWSPYAISTRKIFYSFEVIRFLSKRMNRHVIAFIADPAFYTPYFKLNNIPIKYYYFADDFRGTREFNKFDIAQFQHLVYDKRFEALTDDWDALTKDKNLIFIGSLFYLKGDRSTKFNQYFKDMQSNDCELFIPLKINGIVKKDEKSEEHEQKVQEQFPEIFNDLVNHKSYKGHIKPDEVITYIPRFKYSLILSCISSEDSLNFRIVRDVHYDLLPFLDPRYDPAYLQIPKHIQDQLIVHTAKDIDHKIDYFNKNDSERIRLLDELKEIFRINDYMKDPRGMVSSQIRQIVPEFKY